MPVAAITAAATVGGAAIASGSQRDATRAQQTATNSANAIQQQQYNQSRQDLTPWRISGQAALGEINRRLGLSAGGASQFGAGTQFGGLTSGVTGQTQDVMTNPGTGQPMTGGATQGNTARARYGSDVSPAVTGGILASPMQGIAVKNQNPLGVPAGPDIEGPQVNGGPTGPMGPAVQQGGSNPSDPENRYGGFYASPGYNFRMDEGTRGINANRAASGMLQSGDTLRALTRYGQDYASNEFNTQLNQLFSVAGLGQTATSQGNALGQNYATQVGQNNIAQGNNQASSYANQGNIWQNALGSIGGYAAYQFPGSTATRVNNPPADLRGLY